MCRSHRPAPSCCSRCSASVMSGVQPSSHRTCRSTNGPACSVRRTRQSATILRRVVSHVTITDPHHFLFGDRLPVLPEPSGRGPAFIIVVLPDGRHRSVRIASTDLGQRTGGHGSDELPRISVRTLIPLMQHLSASLDLFGVEVIRDGTSSPSRSRCVSKPAGSHLRPTSGPVSAPMAQALSGDAGADHPIDRCVDAPNATDLARTNEGEGSC